jgi:hypothetical protein
MTAALMGEALALLDHTTRRAPCGTRHLVLDRPYQWGKTRLARSSGVMAPTGRATSPAPSEVHGHRSRAPACFTPTTGCAFSLRFERTVGTRGKGEGERTVEGGGHAQHARQYRSEPHPCGGTGSPHRFGPNSIEQLSGLHITRCGARPVRSPPSAELLREAPDPAERSVREQTRDDWCRCETGRLRQTVLLPKQADQKGAAR